MLILSCLVVCLMPTYSLAVCTCTLRTEEAISLSYPFAFWPTLPEHGSPTSVSLILLIKFTTCLKKKCCPTSTGLSLPCPSS